MEIAPTSIIKLFSGIPLDPTYTDTLYFDTLANQTAFFNSRTPVKTFTSQMYQRVNKGVFQADCKADDIYNCNYMAFQNTGFGDKWFYAFIKKIEYVNNNNSEVTFEIDVMQTWAFDYELKQCFIERQHSYSDAIGGNILPEPVECGEYVYDNYEELIDGLDSYAVVMMVCDVDGNSEFANTTIYDNVCCGAEIYAIPLDTQNVAEAVGWKLYQYMQKPEAILNMYMCPLALMPQYIKDATTLTKINARFVTTHLNAQQPPVGSISDGTAGFGLFTPKNNKLYSYPYTYYHVDNGQGESLACRYEFFANNSPRFIIEGSITSPIQFRLTPKQYKGSSQSQQDITGLRSEFLGLTGYPICSWNYDTYKAWLAQNSVPMGIQTSVALGSAVLGAIAAVASGGAAVPVALGLGASALSTVTSVLTKNYEASIKADTCKGNINTGNVDFSRKQLKYFGGRARITEDYAQAIDGFFTMYGYSHNMVGTPNRSSRPHWNYVKTADCKIVGNCPSDDIKKICEIYNNGVRFWKNANEVGNYNLDNSPT